MTTAIMTHPAATYDRPDNMNPPERTSSPHRKQLNRLSVNVPILLPSHAPSLPVSRTAESPRSTTFPALTDTVLQTSPSPTVRQVAFITATQAPTDDLQPTDFLTLVAQQERKVLELREELSKAENDLDKLKRNWAHIEAQKKRAEVRNGIKRLDRLASDAESLSEIDENKERERERKRQVLENRRVAMVDADDILHEETSNTDMAVKVKRKGSKRVFEGGRHTRTLSLLSPNPKDAGQSYNQIDENTPPSVFASPTPNLETSLYRSNSARTPALRPNGATIPSSISGLLAENQFQLPQGFGRTYKDLANRHSLPPGMVSPEVLYKKGQEVVDGVKGGFWNFWEDMRMVTVGEEAVTGEGVNGVGRRDKHTLERKTSKEKSARSETPRPRKGDFKGTRKEDSFWREFGLDTPRGTEATSAINNLVKADTRTPSGIRVHANGHNDNKHKSSIDSTNPPDLLTDIGQDEEEWDAWESPISLRQQAVNAKNPTDQAKVSARYEDGADEAKKTPGNGLPWPELTRLTPGKLTRTVSDLMKEWNTEPEPKPPRPRGQDMHAETISLGVGDAEHDHRIVQNTLLSP